MNLSCKCFQIEAINSAVTYGVSHPTAYQGKTSISTVGTSTSAYHLSLATMSRSNTGTGTVWEQDSQPSRQPSQDTLSRTDEDDEESQKHCSLVFTSYSHSFLFTSFKVNSPLYVPLAAVDSMSIPSVVSEHEAFMPRVMSQRRFSSHATGSAASQPEAPRTTMLPSHR